MNVVIYARYSSSAQRGDSIDIQLRECYKYCEEHKYNVVNEYIDEAKTGTDDNRPNFRRMINDSSQKMYERIVVYRFNRFFRDKEQSVLYKGLLRRKGIKVESVHEPITDDPTGVIVESIIEAMDEFYSLELSQKIKNGMDRNGEKFLCTGGSIPLGFKVNQDRQFEIDPNTAHIVKTIFTMYADGKTVTEITAHLNSLGCKTSKGVAFNKNSLHTILKNKKYIGVYTYKGKETPDAIPRIVSNELFYKVAEIMAKNKKAPARAKAKVAYLLTTKLFCGHCKEMMTGFSATGQQGTVYNYYICNGRKAKRCNKDMVKKDYIENLLLAQCRKMLSKANIEKISNTISALCEAERDTSNLRYLEKRLADNKRKLENIQNAVIETDNPKLRENLYQKFAQLENEQQTIREEISKETMPFPSLTVPKIKFFLMSLKQGCITDDKYKKLLIKIFINKIYLYDDRITITFHCGDDTVEINERLLSELEEKDGEIKNLFLTGDGPPNFLKSPELSQDFFCADFAAWFMGSQYLLFALFHNLPLILQ